MSRLCMVTGKAVMSGNNVSHAKNRTRRKFMPNVQDTNVFSETLGRPVRLRVSTAGLRTLEHKGGLDTWLVSTAPTKLNPDVRKIRKQIVKVMIEKGTLPVPQKALKRAPKASIAKKAANRAKKAAAAK